MPFHKSSVSRDAGVETDGPALNVGGDQPPHAGTMAPPQITTTTNRKTMAPDSKSFILLPSPKQKRGRQRTVSSVSSPSSLATRSTVASSLNPFSFVRRRLLARRLNNSLNPLFGMGDNGPRAMSLGRHYMRNPRAADFSSVVAPEPMNLPNAPPTKLPPGTTTWLDDYASDDDGVVDELSSGDEADLEEWSTDEDEDEYSDDNDDSSFGELKTISPSRSLFVFPQQRISGELAPTHRRAPSSSGFLSFDASIRNSLASVKEQVNDEDEDVVPIESVRVESMQRYSATSALPRADKWTEKIALDEYEEDERVQEVRVGGAAAAVVPVYCGVVQEVRHASLASGDDADLNSSDGESMCESDTESDVEDTCDEDGEHSGKDTSLGMKVAAQSAVLSFLTDDDSENEEAVRHRRAVSSPPESPSLRLAAGTRSNVWFAAGGGRDDELVHDIGVRRRASLGPSAGSQLSRNASAPGARSWTKRRESSHGLAARSRVRLNGSSSGSSLSLDDSGSTLSLLSRKASTFVDVKMKNKFDSTHARRHGHDSDYECDSDSGFSVASVISVEENSLLSPELRKSMHDTQDALFDLDLSGEEEEGQGQAEEVDEDDVMKEVRRGSALPQVFEPLVECSEDESGYESVASLAEATPEATPVARPDRPKRRSQSMKIRKSKNKKKSKRKPKRKNSRVTGGVSKAVSRNALLMESTLPHYAYGFPSSGGYDDGDVDQVESVPVQLTPLNKLQAFVAMSAECGEAEFEHVTVVEPTNKLQAFLVKSEDCPVHVFGNNGRVLSGVAGGGSSNLRNNNDAQGGSDQGAPVGIVSRAAEVLSALSGYRPSDRVRASGSVRRRSSTQRRMARFYSHYSEGGSRSSKESASVASPSVARNEGSLRHRSRESVVAFDILEL